MVLSHEKKKSDNLLLNILPEETAEELKRTGEAKARCYEEVSVMFTDFKIFTQAAENWMQIPLYAKFTTIIALLTKLFPVTRSKN